MENLAADLISLLRYLLPGFLTAWIFYGFTSYSKPEQFERIIQALIFTLIVQAIVFLIKTLCIGLGEFVSIGVWGSNSELISSILSASVLGFVFAYFANTDKFHSVARKMGLSRETSYASEWFGIFSKKVTFIVLHLNDERRIYGWPTEWPSEPGKGHFSLEQASWIYDDGTDVPITGVDSVLLKGEDVKWVEFMNNTWDKNNG